MYYRLRYSIRNLPSSLNLPFNRLKIYETVWWDMVKAEPLWTLQPKLSTPSRRQRQYGSSGTVVVRTPYLIILFRATKRTAYISRHNRSAMIPSSLSRPSSTVHYFHLRGVCTVCTRTSLTRCGFTPPPLRALAAAAKEEAHPAEEAGALRRATSRWRHARGRARGRRRRGGVAGRAPRKIGLRQRCERLGG